MMKFLRTIRFDDTDDNVFEIAARAGEWAVPGGFSFADLDPEEISGKTRQAFANGFLSVENWGWSTLASVASMQEGDREEIEQKLARHFVENFGAPDMKSALPAAREEVEFAQKLCAEQPVNTVFMLRREFGEEGQLREEFRIVRTEGAEPMHARIWTVTEDEA